MDAWMHGCLEADEAADEVCISYLVTTRMVADGARHEVPLMLDKLS